MGRFNRWYILLLLVIATCSCSPSSGEGGVPFRESLGTPPNTEIWYTTNDDTMITTLVGEAFNAEIVSHRYITGKGVIEFKEPLRNIGDEAFKGCNRVESFALPLSVEEIGDYAFANCNALEAISLGGALRSSGEETFVGCYALATVHIADIAGWCAVSFEDRLSNPIYCAGTIGVDGKMVRGLTIPEGVTRIGDYAFNNLVSITSVALPTTLQSVGESAFEECLSLAKVQVDNVEMWCAIEFEDIYANPLYYAGDLFVKGAKLERLSVGGKVSHIGQYAFINNTSLLSVSLEAGVGSVGLSAFNGCISLKECLIGDSVRRIEGEAFRNCISLKKLSLGSFVQEIGRCAFMNCPKLQTIFCYATMPPVLEDSNTFLYGAQNRTFYVPEESLYEYKENDCWEQYANDIYPLMQ